MSNEIIIPAPIVLLFAYLILGIFMFFVYLALFYFLFTYTKNPKLKSIFWLVIESLMLLFPESWKKEAEKQARKNSKK